MSKSCYLLVLFAALGVALAFAVPAEDVPETSYDESASLPYVSTRIVRLAVPESVIEASVVSSIMPECLAEVPAVRPRASGLRLGFLRRLGEQQLGGKKGWAYPVSDSLTILDHSLRC